MYPQVPPDVPVRRTDSGPSKLAVGVLLGAAVLLLATWQRLTSRFESVLLLHGGSRYHSWSVSVQDAVKG